jgi:hypothetical protein
VPEPIPRPSPVQDIGERGRGFPDDGNVFRSPRPRRRTGSRVHGYLGHCEVGQGDVEPTHRTYVREARLTKIAVVSVRRHVERISNMRLKTSKVDAGVPARVEDDGAHRG